MQGICVQEKNELVYSIEGADEDVERELRKLGYTADNGRLIKRIPGFFQDHIMLEDTFSRLEEEALLGLGQWENALEEILRRCGQAGILPRLLGSCGEAVRGIEVQPHDLDLAVLPEDFFKCRPLFDDCVFEPFQALGTKEKPFFRGRLCLRGTLVELMADPTSEDAGWETLPWKSQDLLVEPLANSLKRQKRRGNEKRVAAIEAYLGRSLTRELKELLRRGGADLAGIGDLSGLLPEEYRDMPKGVCIAIKLPYTVVKSIEYGPTMEYWTAYRALNAKLDALLLSAATFLKEKGYRAVAQTTTQAATDAQCRAPLPHKTVATRAGLGWIGRSALLITPQYGGAVRISSLVTDAPLLPDRPCLQSRCGDCRLCQIACPGKAIQGALWQPGMEREKLLSFDACRSAAHTLSNERLDIDAALCGKCFVVCPFTRRYVQTEEERLKQQR